MIGKRKREVAVAPKRTKPTQEKRASSTADDDDKQAIFRKYFEAQFKPLDEKLIQPIRPTMPESEEEDDLDEDESEWEGLDEEDDTPRVEVIEHTDTGRRNSIDELFNKKDLKAFMVHKTTLKLRKDETLTWNRAPNRPSPQLPHQSRNHYQNPHLPRTKPRKTTIN